MFPALSNDAIRIVHQSIIRSVDNNGNPVKAYGTFKDGIISLAKAHPIGTVYHEAFHYVVDYLLDDAQSERLNELAVERYGTLSKIELEEKLAEDFRNFMNK